MNTFGKILRSLRIESDLTQEELGKKINISKQAISNYEQGRREPDYENLEKIADFFNVDIDYLYGRSVIRNKYNYENELIASLDKTIALLEINGFEVVVDDVDEYKISITKDGKTARHNYYDFLVNPSQSLSYYLGETSLFHSPSTENPIPLLGNIAAGTPILAEQNIEEYFNLDSSIKADFALRVRGDSTIKANINSGDIVFIKQQVDIENGEIGAVLLEDEATLKRIYKEDGVLTLQPENDKYAPRHYTDGNIKILGKLVASLKLYE